jgi:hypothetical protein
MNEAMKRQKATASEVLDDLHQGVASLSSRQRRCLEVVCKFTSVAHAARRLHWSQAALEAELLGLSEVLGDDVLRLQEGKVVTAEALTRLLLN